ncbi:FIST N-terminal domain-containing protein [Roseobacter sinensis]|uniref:FIST C-terminal domain-containing protein n=1 Tax=Roseobacter sinensis TaxID=2931391 RepID=A0ABT3BAX1_9RHOB|nr:FIST N-terminal domain-containing protein [Roseobacter sp. WL0113]MCV3270721.1 FIST C-terminal domain-containing protein [Roseobacter sp. WL0113]
MKMEGAQSIAASDAVSKRLLATVHISAAETNPARCLKDRLAHDTWAQLFVFSPNRDDLERISSAAAKTFPGTALTGCTTAGQIGWNGYAEDGVSVVIGLPARHFATETVRIDDLETLDPQSLIDRLVQARTALADQHADKPNGFGFILVDGLSLREDALAATVAPAMGSWPVFGGSSGDGTRFETTWLAHGDQLSTGSALVTFVRTACETRVFSLNHLEPTGRRMIVTKADPERRIVKEINAEPAAREYARIVNKDPDQLDEFTFSANPVVVRLGDTHHVRAIQRVNEAGELVFFAAIDEGMVLNVAEPQGIAQHLDQELSKIKAGREDVDIFACDCVLRRIEAEQTQATRDLSEIMARNRVVGFSTYGEQIGPLHVNHTMTGVMLVNPDR